MGDQWVYSRWRNSTREHSESLTFLLTYQRRREQSPSSEEVIPLLLPNKVDAQETCLTSQPEAELHWNFWKERHFQVLSLLTRNKHFRYSNSVFSYCRSP